MEEGLVVVEVGGAVVVVGRLHLSVSRVRQEGGGVAACCRRKGSPRRSLRGHHHPFVEVLSICHQAVIRQAPVAGRVVRRGRLIG